MKRAKKTIDVKINDFLADWDHVDMKNFLEACGEVFFLYDVDENDDWVRKEINPESTDNDLANVRMIRTIYLVSKMADLYAGKLCNLKIKHPKLWKDLENECDKKDL